jgi:hypothetical protein
VLAAVAVAEEIRELAVLAAAAQDQLPAQQHPAQQILVAVAAALVRFLLPALAALAAQVLSSSRFLAPTPQHSPVA